MSTATTVPINFRCTRPERAAFEDFAIYNDPTPSGMSKMFATEQAEGLSVLSLHELLAVRSLTVARFKHLQKGPLARHLGVPLDESVDEVYKTLAQKIEISKSRLIRTGILYGFVLEADRENYAF